MHTLFYSHSGHSFPRLRYPLVDSTGLWLGPKFQVLKRVASPGVAGLQGETLPIAAVDVGCLMMIITLLMIVS